MIVEAFLAGAMAATPAPDDDFWYTDYPMRPGGADTSPNGALQVTAVMACVRVAAETIAQLPLHLMATDGRMRRQAIDQPLYDVLHDRPNDWQTSFEYREMMQGHLELRGNAYSQIVPGPRGAVDQLIPLHPDRMEVFRLENKRIGYLYRDRQGIPYRLTQDEVFHLRGMSLDDCVGMSVIAACRNAVELAQQLDQHGIRFYRNAARPSGVIKMPEGFHFEDEDHAKRMGKSWRDAHTGEDLFSVAFLEGGAEWQQLGLSNEDAQWLESKRKSVTEIAMMFRLPPHMIGSAIEHGHTYANVESTDLSFMKHSVLPRARRWEGAIGRDLIVQPQDRLERYYAKFSMEGLLRADSKTRVFVYKTMKDIGAYSVNEIRELEDLNPIEGGDEYKAASPAPSPPALPPPGNQDGDEPADDEADALHSWIADAAQRIANHEITQLERRADKAAADRETFDAWVERHWNGKVQEYCIRTLSPITVEMGKNMYSTATQVASICCSAITQLTTDDPVEVLARWKTSRADEITKLLEGDLNDDK